jgi:hypothetical protein
MNELTALEWVRINKSKLRVMDIEKGAKIKRGVLNNATLRDNQKVLRDEVTMANLETYLNAHYPHWRAVTPIIETKKTFIK